MLTLEDAAKAFELYLLYGDDEGITQVVFEEADGKRKMDDYISRQVALDAMENCEPGEEPFMIKSLPSADVVEVVRCKECKHRDPEDKKCDFGHDIIWQLPRRDDWYCADGERNDG